MRPFLLLLSSLALLATGCGGDTAEELTVAPAAGEGPVVVAADEPLADLARRVAGQRAEVTALVPEGVPVEDYEPGPADLEVLLGADVFFEHGRGLNEPMAILAVQEGGEDLRYVPIGEAVNDPELVYGDVVEHGDHSHEYDANPKLMGDITYVIRYVRSIRTHLAQLDEAGGPEYEANAEALIAELTTLHEAIEEAVATIPEEARTLLAFNDQSWAYFARRYRLGIAPAHELEDPDDVSDHEIEELIADVERAGVPAFFGDEPLPEDVVAAVRDETGAEYHADLVDHTLPGSPGDPEHSYTGMMLAAARTVVEGLGGDASALDAVELGAGDG